MALAPGTRVGPYEVIALVGAGGMGEVYRARDTKLHRDVALKILPEAFTLDGDRIARFRREAQVLASLNHPNIAAIYGLEDSGSTHALVLELVEGPTLADRIAHGPIPLDEALPIAKQIAEALEAAHEQGIIHRDLKPANIKARDDGTVKVLDFGLAKAMDPASTISPALTNSPTITTPAQMTGVGTLLGTAAYMSPEQAKGRPADKRSDVWAFGCVLYEMLTGTRAFEGEDISDTLAAVLRGEPDWTALPSETPAVVRTLMRRCLEKDRRRRIADISPARFVFDEFSTMDGLRQAPSNAVPTPLTRRVAFALLLIAVAGAGLAGGALWIGRRTPPAPVARFSIPFDRRINLGRFASISPDGTKIVYATDRLYIRPLAESTARPIEGTDLAAGFIIDPTFSPDGSAIAFWFGKNPSATGELMTVAVDGGPVRTLTPASIPFGMSWGADGILYAQYIDTAILHVPTAGILRVSPSGGQPQQLVALKDGEIAVGPQMLPGQNALLFTYQAAFNPYLGPAAWDKPRIVVQSLATGRRTVAVEGGVAGRYVSTGHLLYEAGETLMAVPFDAKAQRVTGPAGRILERVRQADLGGLPQGIALFSVSDTGSLLYISGDSSGQSSNPMTVLALMNGKGELQPLMLPPAPYDFPHVSPDGKRIVYSINTSTDASVWTYDLSGEHSPRRLTLAGRNQYPIWSPDGQWIAFQSNRDGNRGIFRQRADGSGTAEPLTKATSVAQIPQAWLRSSTGDVLLFTDMGTRSTLHLLTLADKQIASLGGVSEPTTTPVIASFSPDGHWVAYSTTGAKGPQVYVQSFPATTDPSLIAEGAIDPVWSPHGLELFYMTNLLEGAPRLSSVTITPSPFSVTNPTTLFEFKRPARDLNLTDVLPDGRFIFRANAPDGAATAPTNPPIQVVLNWFTELQQRVPTR